MLHDRLGAEFTYYFGGTKDAILQTQVAPSLGYPGTQFTNAGRLTKHGLELALHGTPYQTKNTEWTLGLNVATADNKVTDLNGAAFLQASTNVRHVVGYPVGAWWVKKVTGSTSNSDGSVTDVMCDDGNGGNVRVRICTCAICRQHTAELRRIGYVDASLSRRISSFS